MTGVPDGLDAKPYPRRQLPRYLLVGAFNSLLDLALFTLLAVSLRVEPLVANICSTAITMCVSYLLNRFWVFGSDASWAASAIRFVGVTLTSALLVQSAVIWLLLWAGGEVVPGLAYEVLVPVAKAAAMGVGMTTNYLGYRWLFG